MLLRGVLALAVSLDLTPAVAPTPIGCSDDSVTVLPVPSVDPFSTLLDLVKLKPVDTPMPISPNRRNFRCLRVGGPARPVLLNLSAGPARQLLWPLLLPREPPRRHCSSPVQPLRLSCAARAVATRAQLHLHLRRRPALPPTSSPPPHPSLGPAFALCVDRPSLTPAAKGRRPTPRG